MTINLPTNRCRATECGTASASLVQAQPECIVKRTATMLRVSDIVSTDIDDKAEEIGEHVACVASKASRKTLPSIRYN